MYYMHWITDQNYQYFWNYDGEADEGWPFNCYAVLRNTRYEVKVKKVSYIGMDLPGREITMRNQDNRETLEGEEYMLLRTNMSSWTFYKEDFLPYLKNKAI